MKWLWTVLILIIAIGLLYTLTPRIGEAPTDESPRTDVPEQTQPETASVEVRLGETASKLGVSITPHIVLEDSRCPLDVTCIQAGTVRIHAELASALGTGWQTFELGVPITTEAEEVTMVSVSPTPHSERTIEDAEYVFRFEIRKRTDI